MVEMRERKQGGHLSPLTAAESNFRQFLGHQDI